MGGRYGEGGFGFEQLEAYQLARELRKAIYRVLPSLPAEERYALGQQMRRAAISLTNNIAEGHGRHTRKDVTHFCRQAKGSLMELVEDINICADQQYVPAQQLLALREQARRAHQVLDGYIRYLQRTSGGDEQ